MPGTIRILPHYTYDDYELWEGNWEVIDGIPFAMSPTPTPKHQIVSGNLLSEFSFQLKNRSNCKVYPSIDYLIQDDIILRPDILMVCKPIAKKFLDFSPVLVIEILYPATAVKERVYKKSIYQVQGIKYYIIVDPDLQEAEVYELTGCEYKMNVKGKDISYSFLLEDCKADIEFKEIWK